MAVFQKLHLYIMTVYIYIEEQSKVVGAGQGLGELIAVLSQTHTSTCLAFFASSIYD